MRLNNLLEMAPTNMLAIYVFACGFVFVSASEVTAGDEVKDKSDVPVRLSLRLVDQYGIPADAVSCKITWTPSRFVKLPTGGYQAVFVRQETKVDEVNSERDGSIVYQPAGGKASGVVLEVVDAAFVKEKFVFALNEQYARDFDAHLSPRGVHQFDRGNPVAIRIWRRIGFKPMICYADQDNELDLASAKGEVCFDVTTFQPVETGGDFVLKWDVGAAVPPQGISWMWSPEGWDRQLHYTITAVDGQIWPFQDDREWLSAHGVIPERMPPGLPVLDVTKALPPGGHPGRQRFLLVSRNGRVCAKVSLAFSLRDALKGLVRVSLSGTMVNPAGPPSLEIQPSRERDKLEANARQQITTINIPLRGIGSGPLPTPGPTADEAWATYEKACVERGVKPIPRPLSR